MLTTPDFDKKQIVVVLAKDGDRVSLLNSNMLIKDKDGNTKLQVSCYRLFLILIIGNMSITTALIQEAKKYGFGFALFTSSFRYYDMIGGMKEGNTLLKEKQYKYEGIDIARKIVQNKIAAQYSVLAAQREKDAPVKEAMRLLKEYYNNLSNVDNRNSIMAYEGLASKIYFFNHFNNVDWHGRQPRIKKDWINSALDIGYTVLFSFIESLLCAYGFDTYCGILHTQFYMRKSLVCDIVEPFRFIIDKAVKKGYNLHQIQEEDFSLVNHQYQLNWKMSQNYVKLFMEAILEEKNSMFLYVQQYYRCFMKQSDISDYPFYYKGVVSNGIDQL